VREWLSRRSAPSGLHKPIERIAAGDYRAVARLASGLEDPGAV